MQVSGSIPRSPPATAATDRAPLHDPGAAGRAVIDLQQLRARREQRIDDELAQSFPASDPPSWVLGTARPPR